MMYEEEERYVGRDAEADRIRTHHRTDQSGGSEDDNLEDDGEEHENDHEESKRKEGDECEVRSEDEHNKDEDDKFKPGRKGKIEDDDDVVKTGKSHGFINTEGNEKTEERGIESKHDDEEAASSSGSWESGSEEDIGKKYEYGRKFELEKEQVHDESHEHDEKEHDESSAGSWESDDEEQVNSTYKFDKNVAAVTEIAADVPLNRLTVVPLDFKADKKQHNAVSVKGTDHLLIPKTSPLCRPRVAVYGAVTREPRPRTLWPLDSGCICKHCVQTGGLTVLYFCQRIPRMMPVAMQ